MSYFRIVVSSIACTVILAGCGTYTPDIAEFPDNIDDAHKDKFVQDMIYSIHCELENAVTDVVNNSAMNANRRGQAAFFSTVFLKKWGAEVTLTLTADEKSILNPNGIFMPVSPPSAIFTLAGTASHTSDATRVNKINYYYKISELYKAHKGHCDPAKDQLSKSSRLIQSDLKIGDWLNSFATATDYGDLSAAPKQNVLSHQVTFDVIKSAGVTPAWKLVRGTVNQSGTFLTGSREGKHDLIITFGPIDPTFGGTSLVPIAENSHATLQLSSALKGAIVSSP